MIRMRSILIFVLKAMITLTVLVVILASIEVNRIAHPKRICLPGTRFGNTTFRSNPWT